MKHLTRRFFLAAGGTTAAAKSVWARFFRGGGGVPALSIASIHPQGTIHFTSGVPSGFVASYSVLMSDNSAPAAVFTATGANTGHFVFSGQSLLEAPAGTATGTYNNTSITAAVTGATNSPFTSPVNPTIIGTAAITSVSPSGTVNFMSGIANGAVATFSLTMSDGSSPTVTWSVGGANSGGFHFSGAVLEQSSGGTAASTYNDCSIIATVATANNSPFTEAPNPTFVGTSGTQTIASVSLASTNFVAASPNGVISAISVTMSPASPTFTGTLSLSPSGGGSGGFQLSSTTLPANLLQSPGGTAAGTYTDLTITATQSGISNSPQHITPTLTGITGTGAFVIANNLTGSPNGYNQIVGANIKIGLSNLLVTSLGRWVLAGNNSQHTLQFVDSVSLMPVGAAVTINCSGAPSGAYLYGALPQPLILAAGHTYYLTSSENTDQLYDTGGGTFTTTGDADLLGGFQTAFVGWYPYKGIPAPAPYTTPNTMFGPLNFQYSLTTNIATMAGFVFVPQGYSAAGPFKCNEIEVVGSAVGGNPVITYDIATMVPYTFAMPADNTIVCQWFIDGQMFGPQIVGPNVANGQFFPVTIDTRTIPALSGMPNSDGTHNIFLQCVDVRVQNPSNAAGSPSLYTCIPGTLIVANTGAPSTGAQTIPIATALPQYLYSPFPDFAVYNGNSTRSVNTFSYPTPAIPPVTSSSNQFFGNPPALRQANNYYVMDVAHTPKLHEFEYDVQLVTTPQGGVYATGSDAELIPSYNSSLISLQLRQFVWDGGRYDAKVSAGTTWIAEASDDGFVGCEHMGRVVHYDHQGNATTIAGLNLNRTVTLPYSRGVATGLTDSQNLTLYKTVGTMSGFTSWPGVNGLCYDPRNSDRLYVFNPITHIIVKISVSTGAASLFAGTEFTGGYTGDGGSPIGATFNAPYGGIMGSDGVMYVADQNNSCIRQITTDSSGNGLVISTLCGNQTSKPTLTQVIAADSGAVNWNPTGSVTFTLTGGVNVINTRTGSVSFTPGNNTTGAYINFPQTIKFKSGPTANNNAQIVLYEYLSETFRLIDLGSNTVTMLFQENQPSSGTNLRNGNFSWMDVDVNGACGPVDDIIVACHNAFYMRDAIDGSFILADMGGDPAGGTFFNIRDSYTEGPVNAGAQFLLDPAQWAYPWAVCFSKAKAQFLISGYRELGHMIWRTNLTSDPNPLANEQPIYGFGCAQWITGTNPFFPRGIRPSFAALHGGMGFGHIGSDIAKTTHDMCVNYNGGSAVYNNLGDGEVLMNSTVVNPNGTAGPDRTSGTLSANALGMGVTPRPEYNIGSYDWHALSEFIRRCTTAGTYPTPAAAGPLPTPTAGPLFTSVTATRLSFSSIQVNWTTNVPTIGFAVASSNPVFNANINAGIQGYSICRLLYGSWSPIESAFATTGHSAVIPWVPMSLPTHFSIVCKDQTGNLAYAQDQTIGATPDGTMISIASPGKLVNGYGEWSIGDLFAGGNVFRIKLNGKYVSQIQDLPGTGLDYGIGGSIGVYQLWIDHGGFIYAFINGDDGYAMYANGGWIGSGDSSARFAPVAGYTVPTTFNPPVAPSPDGTSITGSGAVQNADGLWSISGGNLFLNGVYVTDNRFGNNNSYSPFTIGVSTITVNSHGTVFVQMTADSTWRCMSGLALNPSTGPTASPVPINMTILPAGGNLNAQVSHSAPLGTPVASVTMTLSDGTVVVPGSGELTFYFDGASSFLSWSTPNIVTNTTGQLAGSFADAVVLVTRNGTSFCLAMNVAFT